MALSGTWLWLAFCGFSLLTCQAGAPAKWERLGTCSLESQAGVTLCANRPSDPRHPMPKFLDVSKQLLVPAKVACVDASAYENVLDLSCAAHTRAAAYHRIRDCLVPNFDVIEAALAANGSDDTLLLVPPYFTQFIDVLLPKHGIGSLALPRLDLPSHDRDTCVLVTSAARVFFGLGTRNITRAELIKRGTRFRALAYRRVGIHNSNWNLSHSPTVLLIDRALLTRRNFVNSAQLRNSFSVGLRGSRVATYFGNESIAETIRLFANAQVVFGFHGAGLINVVFCKPTTVVVELTFLLNEDEANPRPFRTNGPGVLPIAAEQLNWLVHALPVSVAHIPNNVELSAMHEDNHDRDHALKQASNISVPPVDMYNVLASVKALLIRLSIRAKN